MKSLCKSIQGCVFGYTQSDEITLILTDYDTIATEPWFGNNVQKIVSVSASMATRYFNSHFRQNCTEYIYKNFENIAEEEQEYRQNLCAKFDTALFDSRVFTLPKEEVCNCLIWRQQDAIRNSIESAGQAYFSPKKLHKKSCRQIQDMLLEQRGMDWNEYPADCKIGSACIRKEIEVSDFITRKKWVIDKEPPIFTQDREYIERWL